MDFKDLNELNFLTIKTDFLLDISNKGENIKEHLLAFKAMDMAYDEIFRLILKSIESLKGRLVDGIIPKLLLTLNEIFNIENDVINVYIDLLNLTIPFYIYLTLHLSLILHNHLTFQCVY